jgi:carbonic anhydrase
MNQFPEVLLGGYRNFMGGRYLVERERYSELAESGQSPKILVIACCDSRAAPETVFDSGPGELFVIRNVANLVPPYAPDEKFHATSAALEYAVQSLRVKHIVVMGHGRCGGIHTALDPEAAPLSPGDFIGSWIAVATYRADKTLHGNDRQRAPDCPGKNFGPEFHFKFADISLRQDFE